jgi:hypothetical protein
MSYPSYKTNIKKAIDKVYSLVSPLFKEPKQHLKTWLVIVGVLIASWAVVFFLRGPEVAEAGWWNETWLYRRAIQISNSNGANLEDFQVAITLDTASLIADGKMQATCADLRITDNNGNVIPHWIEENNPGCDDANTKVWTKVPTVYDGDDATTIYAYYGNAQAGNGENGDNVFEFFDDFSTDTTENYIWSTVDTNSPVNSHNWNQENNWIEIRTGDNDAESPSKNINLPSSGHAQILMTKRLDYPNDNTQYLDITQNSSNYYRFEWQGSAYSAQGIYKRVGGSLVDSSAESGTVDTNDTQYRIDMYWTPAKMILEIDGVERKNISTSNTTEIIPTSFLFYNSQINQDWELIFINKYASTDPTTSLNTEEVSPGPVAYWKFDEGTGTTANDSSGQGNSGTVSGATWQTQESCVSGTCLYSTSSTGVSFPNTNNSLGSSDQISISLWWQPTELHSAYNRSVIWKQTGTGDSNFNLYYFGDYNGEYPYNLGVLRFYGNRGGAWGSISGSYTITESELNKWVHVYFVYDSSVGGQIYINGNPIGSKTGSGELATNNANVNIGSLYSYVDEVKIYPYARTEEQIKSDYIAGAGSKGGAAVFGHKTETAQVTPISSKLVAHWKFDEGHGEIAHDYVGGNHGTLSGTTIPEWTNDGKIGKALNFSESSGYVSVANNQSLDITGELTISAWINLATLDDGANFALVDRGNYSQYQLKVDNSRKVVASLWHNSTRRNYCYGQGNSIGLGQWEHVAITYDGTGTVKSYLNGKKQCSHTRDDGPIDAKVATLQIGKASSYYWNGFIDEVKIYNTALTQEEILQDYNQGMAAVMGQSSANTGSTAPGGSAAQEYCVPGLDDTCRPPVAEWNFEENTGDTAYDTSGNGNDGTLVNMDNSNWVAGANSSGAALSFDGEEGYVTANGAAQSPPFSVFTWVKPENVSRGTVVSLHSSGGNRNIFFWAQDDSTAKFSHWDSTNTYVESNNTFDIDKWHHIGWVIDSSGDGKMYINGQEEASWSNADLNSVNQFSIGQEWDGGTASDFFLGLIDQVRIYDYARTPAQIAWDYNRGKPVGHWRFDECQGTTAYDVSGNENHGTINIGTIAPQTTAGTCTDGSDTSAWYNGRNGKWGASLSFDGEDDYVDSGSGSTIADFTQNFTVGAWIYPNSSHSGGIVARNNRGSPWDHLLQIVSSTSVRIRLWSDGTNAGTGVNYYFYPENLLNKWTHLLYTFDGSKVRAYVNGKEIDNWDRTDPIAYGERTIIGEYTGSSTFDGLIDDVRIYNYALTPLQIKTLYNDGAVRFGD